MRPLLLLAVLLLPAISTAASMDLGVAGKVNRIVERDALEEVESRAAKVDWKKMLAGAKDPKEYRPENIRDLPRAARSKSFLVDMSYTLDMDIPDGKGGVLYPRGYTFNPLDYVPVKKTVVVINGDDRDQVEWFRKSQYSSRIDVMLLLTKGSYVDLGKQLWRPIFYLTEPVAKRFKLKAAPSVVRQEGRSMRVEEIRVPKASK